MPSDNTATTAPVKAPISILKDPAGDFSSKRLESILSFAFGCLTVVGAMIAHSLGVDLSNFPLVQLIVAFLTYSAAMQGVSAFSEKNLYPGGINTQNNPTGGIIGSLPAPVTDIIDKLTGANPKPVGDPSTTNEAVSAPNISETPTATNVTGK